jgi:branched-chain amino acid transport system substrate-binding protein
MPDGAMEHPLIASAGAGNAEGRVYLTFGGVPPSALTGEGGELVERYRKTYRIEPQSYAVYGYVAMQVVLDAVRRAGVKDREAIRAAIAATEQRGGLLGDWRFDEHGDTTLTTMSGNVVKGDDFAFVGLLAGD